MHSLSEGEKNPTESDNIVLVLRISVTAFCAHVGRRRIAIFRSIGEDISSSSSSSSVSLALRLPPPRHRRQLVALRGMDRPGKKCRGFTE